ncbi:MAG TPA: hypothetical protein VGK48_02635 [Terriglobia bacterium]
MIRSLWQKERVVCGYHFHAMQNARPSVPEFSFKLEMAVHGSLLRTSVSDHKAAAARQLAGEPALAQLETDHAIRVIALRNNSAGANANERSKSIAASNGSDRQHSSP